MKLIKVDTSVGPLTAKLKANKLYDVDLCGYHVASINGDIYSKFSIVSSAFDLVRIGVPNISNCLDLLKLKIENVTMFQEQIMALKLHEVDHA